MGPLKRAVLGASLAALLSGVMAMPANAAPASTATSAAQTAAAPSPGSAVIAAGWNPSGYYSSEKACVIAKEFRQAGGYPVAPAAGCYHDPSGYYFHYYTN